MSEDILTDKSPREELQEIRDHVKECPIGWFRGRIMRHLNISDEEVIVWLQKLFFITGNEG